MMKSLLIKAGMLTVTAALVAWIGWPAQEHSFIETPSDAPSDNPVPAQIVASPLSPKAPEHSSAGKPRRSLPAVSKSTALASKLDINRATREEFLMLPGVGEVLAQRMIERRTVHGPYRTVDDLREVKGIGAKRLEKLRPLIVVETVKELARTTRRIDSSQDAQKGQPTRPQGVRTPRRTG